MSTLWMETVGIGGVCQLNQLTFRSVVRRRAARILATNSLLLLSNAIRGLVLIVVAAILIYVGLEFTCFGLCIEGIWSRLCDGKQCYG